MRLEAFLQKTWFIVIHYFSKDVCEMRKRVKNIDSLIYI